MPEHAHQVGVSRIAQIDDVPRTIAQPLDDEAFHGVGVVVGEVDVGHAAPVVPVADDDGDALRISDHQS